MFIESFKLIRTKIENVAKRKNYKAFVFTSAAENEGKTTVSTNTALALAKNGKSVLLIDADLRKPSVYKALGISAANELGLTGVVRGERTLSDSIKYFEKFNLFLLVTSQPVAESTEILAADEMVEIIEAVKYLSKTKTGALIVFQKDYDNVVYSDVGIKINANISTELILTIFHPNTPLHDSF